MASLVVYAVWILGFWLIGSCLDLVLHGAFVSCGRNMDSVAFWRFDDGWSDCCLLLCFWGFVAGLSVGGWIFGGFCGLEFSCFGLGVLCFRFVCGLVLGLVGFGWWVFVCGLVLCL